MNYVVEYERHQYGQVELEAENLEEANTEAKQIDWSVEGLSDDYFINVYECVD